jgi:hypothetical protein
MPQFRTFRVPEFGKEDGTPFQVFAKAREYYRGTYGTRDPVRGKMLVLKAAEMGLPAAQELLGTHYYSGNAESQVRQDHEKAAQLLLKAAEAGRARAQALIGIMYAAGVGVPKHPIRGLKWNRRSSEQGYPVGHRHLGSLYLQGLVVKKDVARGFALHLRAANLAEVAAQFRVSGMYFQGEGTSANRKEAYYWACVAAERGDKSAPAWKRSLDLLINEADRNDVLNRVKADIERFAETEAWLEQRFGFGF